MQPIDELDRVESLAVDRDRDPPLELDHDLHRGRGVGRSDRPFEGVGRGRDPRVLEHAGLARSTPEVHVDRVGRGLRDRDLDAALDRVVDLLVAGEPHADSHRGHHLESRVERVDRDVEADLVVALAGAPVGDRIGAFATGDLDEQLGDQRPRERGGQRVRVLVQRVRLEMRPDEVADEPLPRIDDVGSRGAGADGSLLHAVPERAATDVDRQADDLAVVLLSQPGDGDGRIEPAGVGEDDLLHAGLRSLGIRIGPRPRARGWIGSNRSAPASGGGGLDPRTGPAACCRPPAFPPAPSATTRRSPGR